MADSGRGRKGSGWGGGDDAMVGRDDSSALLSHPKGVAVIDNLVYAVGGSNRDDGTRSNLNSMERYNPERNEWEDMPPMHRSRGAASVTALNGCLYAVGGYDSGVSVLTNTTPMSFMAQLLMVCSVANVFRK